jgi:hypothetical protein
MWDVGSDNRRRKLLYRVSISQISSHHAYTAGKPWFFSFANDGSACAVRVIFLCLGTASARMRLGGQIRGM